MREDAYGKMAHLCRFGETETRQQLGGQGGDGVDARPGEGVGNLVLRDRHKNHGSARGTRPAFPYGDDQPLWASFHIEELVWRHVGPQGEAQWQRPYIGSPDR